MARNSSRKRSGRGRIWTIVLVLILLVVAYIADPAGFSEMVQHELGIPVGENYTQQGDNISIETQYINVLPPYNGVDVIELNNNIPDFNDYDENTASYVDFAELDGLGRTGTANAILGPETLPKTGREPMKNIKPSGWVNVEYPDQIKEGYLYNRTHLIGFLLCGDSGTAENLITGTRYLNATLMLPYELKAARYIEDTGCHVRYQVEPVYEGSNLVASAVHMQAESVEDGGEGLAYNVVLYNVQPGIIINYATGESRAKP